MPYLSGGGGGQESKLASRCFVLQATFQCPYIHCRIAPLPFLRQFGTRLVPHVAQYAVGGTIAMDALRAASSAMSIKQSDRAVFT
jgi:hypothetical protein